MSVKNNMDLEEEIAMLKKENKEDEQTDSSSPRSDRDSHERNPETQRKVEKIREEMDAKRDKDSTKAKQ